MGFIRLFDDAAIDKMKSAKNAEILERLMNDVAAGEVFPAVRVNELHFYYKGGCLYKFTGSSFERDPRYAKYAGNAVYSNEYERAKAENANKFTAINGGKTERQLLDGLCCHTFGAGKGSDVVVLDIEVNLGGRAVRKCDLVLMNVKTAELMFVEGKVFSDRRVKSALGRMPEVIEQVNLYSSSIALQKKSIIEQYGEHVRIINKLFGTGFCPPQTVIEPAKLLVLQMQGGKTENARYTVDIIEKNLGTGNVMWVSEGEPSLSEIWSGLTA